MMERKNKLFLLFFLGLAVTLGIAAWREFNAPLQISYAASERKVLTLSGVTMEVRSAYQDGEFFRVDVCYSLPDERDWTLTSRPEDALLRVGVQTIPVREEGVLSYEFDASGVPIKRCQYLLFPSKVAGGSQVSLTIQKIFVSEPDKVDCAKLQGQLDALNAGITVQCPGLAEKNIGGFTVIQRPPGMTLRDALNYASDVLTDARKGPWEFIFQSAQP